MESNGQIFSVDLILAMVLVVFCVGTIMASAEIKSYEIKEETAKRILLEKSGAALGAFTGGPLAGCKITDTNSTLAFSIDKGKLGEITKKKLGLQDYNVFLGVTTDAGELRIIDDIIGSANVTSIDTNVLLCDGEISYSLLGQCLNSADGKCGSAGISRQKLSLRVGK